MYLHVLPCTCISRGTGLSGTALYLIVPISLPCTALYCHVSRRGQEDTRRYDSVPEWTSWHVPVCIRIFQQEEICVVHAGMYSYIPACTDMNQYILVYTCSTCWYVLVHSSMYWYEQLHTGIYQHIQAHISIYSMYDYTYKYILVHTIINCIVTRFHME